MKTKFYIKEYDTRKVVEDLLVSALEGGSNYWYERVAPYQWPKRTTPNTFYKALLKGFTIDDKHDKSNYRVTPNDILKALSLMHKHHPSHYCNAFSGNGDATTGDVFLQLCVFEEIVYG